jgi:hypothetical protein
MCYCRDRRHVRWQVLSIMETGQVLNLLFQAPAVLVAVRTALVSPSTASDIEGLDVNFTVGMLDNASEAGPPNEREMWGEDPTIECFELTVRFDNLYMGM